MKYRSVFDIIGPVMIGPSSSHTAGAVRLGRLARLLFGQEPQRATIHFYGSFAKTHQGHATDVAVASGILGFNTDDPRIRNSLVIARQQGIVIDFFSEEAIPSHPNTMKIELASGTDLLELTGISIGGGAVEITELNGFPLKLSGESPAILIFHQDVFGAIAMVTGILASQQINISHMEVSRIEKGKIALMVIETDQPVPPEAIQQIVSHEQIVKAILLDENGQEYT